MEARVAAIRAGRARRAGLAARASAALHRRHQRQAGSDLLQPHALPGPCAGRGGQYTYHGPGQRVAYVMLDLRRRGRTCAASSATSRNGSSARWPASTCRRAPRGPGRRLGRRGPRGRPREDKIAAIGVRVRHWVTFHGIALNVEPDLAHFAGIVPCGIAEHGVTSLVDLGLPVTMADLDTGPGRDLRRGVRLSHFARHSIGASSL